MKNINKYIVIVTGLFLFFSCETLELDLTEDPNFLTPEQADVDFFLNSIQEDFVRHIEGDADNDVNDNQSPGLSTYGSDLTRQTGLTTSCLLYTSPSPRDLSTSRMPSSA